jgi:hypothetical protein
VPFTSHYHLSTICILVGEIDYRMLTQAVGVEPKMLHIINATLDISLGSAKTNDLNSSRKCLIWSKVRKPGAIDKLAVDYKKSKP